MRKTALIAAALFIGAALVYAGDSTLSYSTGQSSAIQNQLIPRYNAEHCTRYGQAVGCASGDLVAGGCSVASNTFKTIVTDSCTIFTSNAAGEAAFLKEVANIGLVTVFNRLMAAEQSSYLAAECARFKALTGPQQQTECTLRGLPSNCSGPCN